MGAAPVIHQTTIRLATAATLKAGAGISAGKGFPNSMHGSDMAVPYTTHQLMEMLALQLNQVLMITGLKINPG